MGAVIRTVPVYIPAAKPVVTAPIVIVPELFPLAGGLTRSHPPGESGVAVQFKTPEPLLVMFTRTDDGLVPTVGAER